MLTPAAALLMLPCSEQGLSAEGLNVTSLQVIEVRHGGDSGGGGDDDSSDSNAGAVVAAVVMPLLVVFLFFCGLICCMAYYRPKSPAGRIAHQASNALRALPELRLADLTAAARPRSVVAMARPAAAEAEVSIPL